MGMKVCKDCGTEVSKSAKTCPKCGRKLKHGGLRIILGILIIIIGIGAIAGASGTKQTSNNPTEKFSIEGETNGYYDGVIAFYIEGTIKNNTDKKYSYVQVTFNLYDESGAQIGTAIDNINNLEPNGTWKFKALGSEGKNVASYKFVEITGW